MSEPNTVVVRYESCTYITILEMIVSTEIEDKPHSRNLQEVTKKLFKIGRASCRERV